MSFLIVYLAFLFTYTFALLISLKYKNITSIRILVLILFNHLFYLLLSLDYIFSFLPLSINKLVFIITFANYTVLLFILKKDYLFYLSLISLITAVFLRIFLRYDYIDFLMSYFYLFLLVFLIKWAYVDFLSKFTGKNFLQIYKKLILLIIFLNPFYMVRGLEYVDVEIASQQSPEFHIPLEVKQQKVMDNYESLIEDFIGDIGVQNFNYNSGSLVIDNSENALVDNLYVNLDNVFITFCNDHVIFKNSFECNYDNIKFYNEHGTNKVSTKDGQLYLGVSKEDGEVFYYIPLEYLLNTKKYESLKNYYKDIFRSNAYSERVSFLSYLKGNMVFPLIFSFILMTLIIILIIFENLRPNIVNIKDFIFKNKTYLSLIGVLILVILILLKILNTEKVYNNKILNFKLDESFYYKNFLVYHPDFNRIENINYIFFTKDSFLNHNYVLRIKDFKDFSKMVLDNIEIRNIFIQQDLSTYLYVDYNYDIVDSIQIELRCSDIESGLFFYPKLKTISVSITNLNEFGTVNSENFNMFKYPGCLNDEKNIVFTYKVEEVLFNHPKGSVVSIKGLNPKELQRVDFVKTDGSIMSFKYLGYEGQDYKKLINDSGVLYNISKNNYEMKVLNGDSEWLESTKDNLVELLKIIDKNF